MPQAHGDTQLERHSFVVTKEQRWLLAFASAYILWGYLNKLISFPRTDPWLYWSFEIGAAALPIVVLLALHRSALTPTGYGLNFHIGPKVLLTQTLLAYLAFGFVMFLLQYPVWGAIWRFEYITPDHHLSFPRVGGAVAPLLSTVHIAMYAAIEEIVYRGMLYQILRTRFVYMVLSPVLFAGMHYNLGLLTVILAGLLGLAACMLFLRWRNVLPLIAAHFAMNVTLIIGQ